MGEEEANARKTPNNTPAKMKNIKVDPMTQVKTCFKTLCVESDGPSATEVVESSSTVGSQPTHYDEPPTFRLESLRNFQSQERILLKEI